MDNQLNTIIKRMVDSYCVEKMPKRVVAIVTNTSIPEVSLNTALGQTIVNANNPYLQKVYVKFIQSSGKTACFANKSGEFVYPGDKVYIEYHNSLSDGYVISRISGEQIDYYLYGNTSSGSNEGNLSGEQFLSKKIDGVINRIDSLEHDIEKSTYTFTQARASTRWEVSHNLGKYPSVTIVDSAGTQLVGEVTYTDENNIVITFTAAFSGKAYLN